MLKVLLYKTHATQTNCIFSNAWSNIESYICFWGVIYTSTNNFMNIN